MPVCRQANFARGMKRSGINLVARPINKNRPMWRFFIEYK